MHLDMRKASVESKNFAVYKPPTYKPSINRLSPLEVGNLIRIPGLFTNRHNSVPPELKQL
jgi:hypothetical protein